MDNGSYPRYTLRGKTLSSGRQYSAYLFGKFKCDYQSNHISVFIEDVVTNKPGKHLGTWMLNQLIKFLRQADITIQFEEIYGDFKPRNEQQALAFFSRFGFVKCLLPTGREKITCGIGELHLVPISDLKEIDFMEIVREWHAAKFGA